MNFANSNTKPYNLERETLNKLRALLNSNEKLSFGSIIENLKLCTNFDEKFVLVLISFLNKKCSSELLLALLYIIS